MFRADALLATVAITLFAAVFFVWSIGQSDHVSIADSAKSFIIETTGEKE